jgi:hypothetical protein
MTGIHPNSAAVAVRTDQPHPGGEGQKMEDEMAARYTSEALTLLPRL